VLVLLVGALAAGYWAFRERKYARWCGVGAGVLAVYLLSVGLVDEFQGQVGGAIALEELEKRAQAGLSILWAVLGGATFVAGVLRFGVPVRIAGLQLLGLATVKVFVWDLSTLDTSYRVLSFIGLGVLLLLSSLLYQHFTRGDDDDISEAAAGDAARSIHRPHA
jgi:uncharacterized membrane protein